MKSTMNKKTVFCLLACSTIAVTGQTLAQEEEGEDEGFSFSADEFALAPEAPPPPPVYYNFVQAEPCPFNFSAD